MHNGGPGTRQAAMVTQRIPRTRLSGTCRIGPADGPTERHPGPGIPQVNLNLEFDTRGEEKNRGAEGGEKCIWS